MPAEVQQRPCQLFGLHKLLISKRLPQRGAEAHAPNGCTDYRTHPFGAAGIVYSLGLLPPPAPAPSMSDLLSALLLGILEGLTEFLPISSTGHLLIAQHWLGVRSELFTVAIQAGAILAVVAIYWRRLWDLTLNLAQPANRSYLFKLLAANPPTTVMT